MPAPETGRKPTTTQQLSQRLNEQVAEKYRKLIEVHILDVYPSAS